MDTSLDKMNMAILDTYQMDELNLTVLCMETLPDKTNIHHLFENFATISVIPSKKLQAMCVRLKCRHALTGKVLSTLRGNSKKQHTG